MSKFKVYFPTGGEIGVTVDAEDYEEAIDKAYDVLPEATLCAQCSGWRRQWSRDESDDKEAAYVFDATGKQVWSEKDGEAS